MLVKNVLPFFLLVFHTICAKTTDEYAVAIVQYQKQTTSTSDNARKYLQIIDSVNRDVDFIIFPEGALTIAPVIVPEIYSKTLCNSNQMYEDWLKELSCKSMQNSFYIIVNVDECDANHCEDEDYGWYNTDIVFDSVGVIVAKYRKFNSFGQTVTRTDKGNFTIIRDFNISAYDPASNKDVNNFIIRNGWSKNQFLNSLQIQQSFSYNKNVNVLSIPYRNGTYAIFAGRKGTVATFEATNMSQPGDYAVKIVRFNKHQTYMENEALQSTEFTYVDLDVSTVNRDICHSSDGYSLCCNFEINMNPYYKSIGQDVHYKYKMIVGTNTSANGWFFYGAAEACGVIACTGTDINTCGHLFVNISDNVVWPSIFKNISITALFSTTKGEKQHWEVEKYLSDISSNEARFVSEDAGDSLRKIILSLKKPQEKLLRFAIYSTIPPPETTSITFWIMVISIPVGCVILGVFIFKVQHYLLCC